MDGSKDTSMELKDIEAWIYDSSYFLFLMGIALWIFQPCHLQNKNKY